MSLIVGQGVVQAVFTGAVTPFLQANSIVSIIVGPTSNRPLASMRLRTDGDLQSATGSTGAALSYSNLANDQWDDAQALTAGDFEVFFDSTTNSATGAATSWVGATRDSWISCGTQRTWTLEKDSSSTGTGQHVIILEIREIANTSNTSGQFNQTFTVGVDL